MPQSLSVLLAALLALPTAAQEAPSLAPRVAVQTTHGRFVLELDAVRAPLSTENFLHYVRSGFYDGTLFHRVIANFVVQGGGYDAQFTEKTARAAIPNESGNGLSNLRGTVGLARTETPHSGSSQFYINVNDNPALDPKPTRWGYAVFGRVVEGMDTVDRIAHLATAAGGPFTQDLPLERALVVEARVQGEEPADAPPATP